MEERSAESVLASASPVELFGTEALKSPTALKRAYAKLIRQYGPDHHPDVFAHIRALYERARAGDVVECVAEVEVTEPGVEDFVAAESDVPSVFIDPRSALPPFAPVPESASMPESTPVSEDALSDVSPADALSRYLEEEAWQSAEKLLTDEAGHLLANAPALWLEAAWAVTEACVFQTPPARLRRRLKILDAIGFEVDVDTVQHLEALLLLGLEVAEARDDPKVPDALIVAICDAYFADDVRCAERWLALNETLGEGDELEDAVVRLLCWYPGLHRAFNQIGARVSGAEVMHHKWLESGRLGRRPSLKDSRLRWALRNNAWWMFKPVRTLVLLVPFILFTLAMTMVVKGLGSLIGVLIAVGIMSLVERWIRRRMLRRPSAWNAELRRRTIAVMQRQVLWPHEVVAASMSRVKNLEEYVPSKTLIDLEQDRSLIAAAMTPAHVARVRGRNEEKLA